jgi:hypothetical protein
MNDIPKIISSSLEYSQEHANRQPMSLFLAVYRGSEPRESYFESMYIPIHKILGISYIHTNHLYKEPILKLQMWDLYNPSHTYRCEEKQCRDIVAQIKSWREHYG